MALRDGLQQAAMWNHSHVIVESDCLVNIQALHNGSLPNTYTEIVLEEV